MSKYQSFPDNEAVGSSKQAQDGVTTTGSDTNPESPAPPSTHTTSSSDIEQTPLLNNQRFLDPDDPKVSPLNLYKVRMLRVLVMVLVGINVVLFFGFLLTDFISIPGLNNRGKSFLELVLVLISLCTNLLTIWCFAVPVYYERILGYITVGLLAIDFIVIFCVAYMRDQFGLIGNFILLWTGINIMINCLVDYWVEQGKKYQEIRYTGRIEKRRSVFELLVILTKTVVKLFLLWVVWNISLTIWLQTFDSHEQPWGKMISVADDKFKVHLACFGDVTSKGDDDKDKKQPILLLEGGQLTSSEEFQEWVEELYHLNKIERYCIWDRPGYGFSDSAPSPVSIGIITEYLLEALRKEKIEGPFSLVGFDVGGLYSRMFASRNPGKVHSLLLVDSWHQDLLKNRPFSGTNRKNERNRTFKNILELMDTKTGFKLWFKGLISPLGLVSNIHWFFHPKKHSSKSRIFGHDMYYQSKYVRARLQEQITSSILSYNEIEGTDIHNLPVSVISSDFMIKNSLNWGKWQRELSKLSDRTIEWVIAENSEHFIWESPKGREQLQQLLLRLVSEKTNY